MMIYSVVGDGEVTESKLKLEGLQWQAAEEKNRLQNNDAKIDCPLL